MRSASTKRRVTTGGEGDGSLGRVNVTIHEDVPRALFPLEATLSKNEIDPIDFLEAYLDGDAPPPVRLGKKLFFDADTWAAWLSRKKVEALDDARRLRSGVWELGA